ncbi:hypothetical protein SAMN05444158_0952 [Bradyrhizobium canariense]|uniref:Uncharacterized protein n=2 Tax=Bradyrhizobium canariense TaxID=255045 RepID=A0A1H1PB97_9BRAD|nr:hypothetical protein SAMN05444158_0952 [Bradyrhizobium canariense]
MRVAVIVVSMLMVTTPSKASSSCMSKTEARQHFGSVHIYWHGAGHCWDATSVAGRRQIIVHKVARKVDRSNWRDSMSKMMAEGEPVQTAMQTPLVQTPIQTSWADRWVDRWVEIEPTTPPLAERWVDIDQVTPPLVSEPNPVPRGVVLMWVLVVIALTLGVVEILFRVALGAGEKDQAVA